MELPECKLHIRISGPKKENKNMRQGNKHVNRKSNLVIGVMKIVVQETSHGFNLRIKQ